MPTPLTQAQPVVVIDSTVGFRAIKSGEAFRRLGGRTHGGLGIRVRIETFAAVVPARATARVLELLPLGRPPIWLSKQLNVQQTAIPALKIPGLRGAGRVKQRGAHLRWMGI